MSYRESIERSVVRYDGRDQADVRAFQRTHFGERARQADDAFYEWLFERNPHRDLAGPPLWLCKRDGAIVGQQGGIPFALKVGENEYRAAWVIDLMVHPQWRLKGIAPALFSAFRESVDVAVGLGVEDNVYRSFVRAGWIEVDTMTLDVRPLDLSACADALGNRQALARWAPRPLFTGTARMVSGVAAALARVELEPIERFDAEADAIWTAASPDYPILSRRDFTMLKWRYDEGPHRELYRRYYLRRGGRVVGYAIVRFQRWHGHIAARLVDYLVPRKLILPLLALVIDAMRAENAVAVFIEQVLAGQAAALLTLGCIRVRRSWRLMYHARPGDAALAQSLARAQSWFVTPGDSDFEHIWIANRGGAQGPAPDPTAAAPREG